MEKVLAVFIPIALFICVTLCIYFINRFKYEAITKLGGPIPRNPRSKYSIKKIGIIIIGFALGLLTTGIAYRYGLLKDDDTQGFFIVGIISLFVGTSFILAEYLSKDDDSTIQHDDDING